jgi:chaperonin GroEL (HSP60 family)
MKQITFLVSDETTEAIRQMGDRKLRGRVWQESHNGNEYLRFEPYRKHSTKCTPIVVCIVVAAANELNVELLKSKENVTL